MFKRHLVKQLLILFLDFGAWRESGNRLSCPLSITFNCVGCTQNTSRSGLNSVSHTAVGSCSAMPFALPAPVVHTPPREGSPLLWIWQGCTAPLSTNCIDNVTPEDKDVCEVSIYVCPQMKHIQLPGQHLTKLVMLQKMIISQIKQLLGNYKKTWHKAGARLKRNIKEVWKLVIQRTDLAGKTTVSGVCGSAHEL